MNKLKELFNHKKSRVLSIYFTAGYPGLQNTGEIIEILQDSGADIIEVGIPFSDPVADGPTIQESNKRALENGMNLQTLFNQLLEIRKKVKVPLILMGYLNPVIKFGVEKFLENCKQCGVDGLILPDLPVREYEEMYRKMFEEYGLSNVFLITPNTSEERIRQMDKATDSFIYMVSSPSITGAKSGIDQEQERYFERIAKMELKNPRLIGFGISDHASFEKACEYSNGAIIGSAFINVLSSRKNWESAIVEFIKEVKGKE